MIYTDMTKKAINICFEKHKNQVDKSGLPYVFHPWHVAEQMNDENSTIVALLHDILEDTDTKIEELMQEGFNNEIIEALDYLNHREDIDYFDYIQHISENELATKVKLADLRHNMDLSRIKNITIDDIKRLERYKKSFEFLKEVYINRKTENTNRHVRG